MRAIKPWGILSSTILLCIWGGMFVVIGFSASVPEIGFFLVILGVFLLIIGYGLLVQDSIAWWIALFMAIGIPVVSVGDLLLFMAIVASVGDLLLLIAIIFGILLLLGLLNRETIKAIKPGIKYEGWFFEDG